MGKYNYMNLNQKMIRIRKKVPKLIRKRYSEDVTYDFVKLDDIYECLTPALNKYGVDFDILSERPTQMDEQGNSVFLKEMGALWRYEADRSCAGPMQTVRETRYGAFCMSLEPMKHRIKQKVRHGRMA